jgi:antagonist of KipI
MSAEFLAPGLLTSVQDGGRHGSRALGVRLGGAADTYSLRIANLLVGNDPGAAALEITLNGPTLRLQRAATIALCGATIDAHADGIALPGWRPIALPAGCTLTFGTCRRGARAYLAFDGGIDVPVVLGSRSTDLRGGFGGHEGRCLRAGDLLALGASTVPVTATAAPRIASWWIDAGSDLDFADSIAVRVLPGSDAMQPVDALHMQDYAIDAASDRQGLRLRGTALQLADAHERISEPVVPGTVQLPPDGQPIVLLADAQTVGGYPRIGHVIAADLPRLAQRRAGQHLRFIPIDQAEAQRANAAQQTRLARIAVAILDRQRRSLL